ncbi:MAG: LPS assembly lipoprotein LptE [Rhizobiaceae bacterium]
MSLPETRVRPGNRAALVATLLVAASVVLPACTVRPLYSSAPLAAGGVSTPEALSSIAIKPVATRYAQQVRNHLIFLFGGGRGEPASARYSMTLTVSAGVGTAARLQVADEYEPSAATVTMRARYVVTDLKTDAKVSEGTREITSSYDVPRQEFAALRAQIDAEDRAARELAELIRLSVAQELSAAGTL